MMKPLVPPFSGRDAVGAVPLGSVPPVTVNDITHPPPPHEPRLPLSWTFTKIKSTVPLKASVIGEQTALPLVRVGPVTGAPITFAAIGIR